VVTCEQATQVDPAAYLAEPQHPQWSEFRAHYPGCPDCARQVAAWNRLEVELRAQAEGAEAAHPENAQLVRLVEAPSALSAEQWSRIDGHLRECRRCADKVAALKEFDFEAVAAAAPASPMARIAGGVRSAGEGLQRRLASWAPKTAEALEELLPWRQPEVVFQTRRDAARPKVAPASDERGAPEALLAAVEGERTGDVYSVFQGVNRIGRALDCEVQIPSDDLARIEAELTASADGLVLRASRVQSTLRVNGEPTRETTLQDGDLVEIAGHRLRLRIVGARGGEG
jgi:hypothetical protein